jgi:hypothetical protein
MVPNRTDDLCEASYLEPQLIDEVGYSMTRYYFDTRDGAEFIRDELGIELDGIEAARDEATRGLADFAGTRFPAPFGGSLRSSVATKPTATFSGPHCGLRLLCLPHELEAGRISAEHVTLRTAFCQPLPRGEQLAKPLLGAGNHLVVELES